MANQTIPTKLIVASSPAAAIEMGLLEAQTFYCKQKAVSSCLCSECTKIKTLQHHGLLVIQPEDSYTIKDLEQVFELTQFSRAATEPFFIIFAQAELFTAAVGNRLLKLLEEPPAHYYFILLTNNEETILPTIRSRAALIKNHQTNAEISDHPLFSFFNKSSTQPVMAFEEALKEEVHHTTSYAILTSLLASYMRQQKEALYENNSDKIIQLQNRISFITASLKKPPQQGGSNLFWKQFYLNFQQL